MAIEVRMPKFGLTMQEGTVQRFFKAVGDQIQAGEPLYEIETEKVLYEVEAPGSGVLAMRAAEPEAVVACGGLVAVIAETGEAVDQVLARYGQNAGAAAPKGADSASVSPVSAGAAEAAPAETGRRPVSPVARKLAAELNVDLDKITGTGPGGRISREDVERAAAAGAGGKAPAPAAAAKPTAPAAATSSEPRPGDEAAARTHPSAIPLRGMRKVIAERMHQSLHQQAQLTITSEADVTAAVEFRARAGKDPEFTYTDMLIQAVARALKRHPRVNARMAETEIVLIPGINIGMAVALEEGLIVPVIHDADRKSLSQIGAETKALGEKARSGRLKLEDVSGGTFTVTNLGTYGVDAFTPISMLGELAILGVGRIVEKPAIYRGEIARRSMMMLSLTFDHRSIDGAPAAAFLQTVISNFNYGER